LFSISLIWRFVLNLVVLFALSCLKDDNIVVLETNELQKW
jgi:hypothetical protein